MATPAARGLPPGTRATLAGTASRAKTGSKRPTPCKPRTTPQSPTERRRPPAVGLSKKNHTCSRNPAGRKALKQESRNAPNTRVRPRSVVGGMLNQSLGQQTGLGLPTSRPARRSAPAHANQRQKHAAPYSLAPTTHAHTTKRALGRQGRKTHPTLNQNKTMTCLEGEQLEGLRENIDEQKVLPK